MSKKSRGPNFSSNEKEILIHLITKYKDVVENKKTDGVTTTLKNEGWKNLKDEFNSLSSFCPRTADQLKTCWDNIKRSTRKEKAKNKKEIFLTGGGKPDQPPPGPLQGQVEAILGPTLDGLSNPYDSDALFSDSITIINSENETNLPLAEVAQVESIDCTTEPEPSTSQNNHVIEPTKPASENKENAWSAWSPALLKTKVCTKLSTKKRSSTDLNKNNIQRRRPKTSLQEEILRSKLELVETTTKQVECEGELKYTILQEQLKQEKLKTEILQLQIKELYKNNI